MSRRISAVLAISLLGVGCTSSVPECAEFHKAESNELVLKAHEIRDISAVFIEISGPDSHPPYPMEPGPLPEKEDRFALWDPDELAQFVSDQVLFSTQPDGSTMAPLNGLLFVRATPCMQEKISVVLAEVRSSLE